MKAFYCFLFALCLPGFALAGWTRCPGSETDTGTSDARLRREESACLRQETATDPARVDARACNGGVDVIFNSEVDGATYTATVMPYQCAATGDAGDFADCEKILVDRSGDLVPDDVPMTGSPTVAKDALYGISPGWLAFDVENTGSTLLELRIVCR